MSGKKIFPLSFKFLLPSLRIELTWDWLTGKIKFNYVPTGIPHTWEVPKTVRQNGVHVSSWTKEETVGVWVFKGQERKTICRKMRKITCLVHKCLLGHSEIIKHGEEFLTDFAKFLPSSYYTPNILVIALFLEQFLSLNSFRQWERKVNVSSWVFGALIVFSSK